MTRRRISALLTVLLALALCAGPTGSAGTPLLLASSLAAIVMAPLVLGHKRRRGTAS